MPLSPNALGSVMMTGSMLFFAINDGMMKISFLTLPVGEGILIRGVMATGLLVLLAALTGALGFRPTRAEMGLMIVRSVADAFGTICFLLGLAALPLATASAVLQAAPLAVTLAAALFLAEPVGWRRWAAILVGFAGMLVMLRPGSDFDPMMLAPVGAVLAIVVRDIATRKLTTRVPALYASTITAAIIAVVGAAMTLIEGFVPPTPGELGIYALASVMVIGGYVLGVNSMRFGDISAVSPFRYTVLLFSVVIGYLLFGDVPDEATFAGGAIVTAAGLYTLWRETKVSRSRIAAASPVREFAPE